MSSPVVLCILDGWGLKKDNFANAPLLAKTPVFDELLATYPNNKMYASEKYVGLPEGQMGNSEVGHINLGAGRIVYTGLSLINKMVEEDTLKDKKELQEVFNAVSSKNNATLHFMILGSFGGVHAHLEHFFYLAKVCKERKQPYILHVFTDGRDVPPNQSLIDIKKIYEVVKNTGGKLGVISGRYFAMDRDKNWDRTMQTYNYLIGKDSTRKYSCPIEYISSAYASGTTDEFILPAINKDASDSTIKNDDVVVFLNYRPDRARQLSHLFVGSSSYDFNSHDKLSNITFFSMMEYDGIKVKNTLFPPFDLKNTLGEVLSKNSITQLRIAETEKYPHVTHFFDGGKTIEYPKMKKILIPSPKVATYDLKPEMSAYEICDALLPELSKQQVVILNFANPDMVGHTGSLDATIKACEAVDIQLGKIYQEVKKLNGTLIVVADHGNAEVMMDENKKPHTAHTTNLVPVIICKHGIKVRANGKLADIAPTILDLLNINKPEEMTGETLIEK